MSKRAAESPAAGPDGKRHHGHELGSRDAFLDVYADLKKEVLEEILPGYGLPKEVADYQAEVMDYNVPGGKLNRGLSVVHALQSIKGAEFTKEDHKAAAVLGWCIEWLQAFFLVSDDIMDASPTRRGQPCWYKLPKVGMVAINDAFLLQSHLYKFLKNHFGKEKYYTQLLDLFIETTWQTELGQQMDLTSQPAPAVGPVDLERFTIERYRGIVKHKTAFYSFYLPIACALVLAGLGDNEKLLKASEAILVEMGEYFQIQDDVLDCFADEATLGKVGTDIQDNKCSWLVVQALSRANDEQKALLKANYGHHEKESVEKVKDLYREMKLQELYNEYEEKTYANLCKQIKEVCSEVAVPEEVYLSLLHKIYKRAK